MKVTTRELQRDYGLSRRVAVRFTDREYTNLEELKTKIQKHKQLIGNEKKQVPGTKQS